MVTRKLRLMTEQRVKRNCQEVPDCAIRTTTTLRAATHANRLETNIHLVSISVCLSLCNTGWLKKSKLLILAVNEINAS